MNEWLRPGSSSSPWIRAAEFAPTSRMRTAVRPVESTVSVAVRNTVSPRVRARNFTRASLCPRFGSKLKESDRYASVSQAWVAWSAGAAPDGRLALIAGVPNIVTVRNTTRPDALLTSAQKVMAVDGGTGSRRITTLVWGFRARSRSSRLSRLQILSIAARGGVRPAHDAVVLDDAHILGVEGHREEIRELETERGVVRDGLRDAPHPVVDRDDRDFGLQGDDVREPRACSREDVTIPTLGIHLQKHARALDPGGEFRVQALQPLDPDRHRTAAPMRLGKALLAVVVRPKERGEHRRVRDVDRQRAGLAPKSDVVPAPVRVARRHALQPRERVRHGLERHDAAAVAGLTQELVELAFVGADVEDAVHGECREQSANVPFVRMQRGEAHDLVAEALEDALDATFEDPPWAGRRLITHAGRIREPAGHEPPPSPAHLRQRPLPCEGEAESSSVEIIASSTSPRAARGSVRFPEIVRRRCGERV